MTTIGTTEEEKKKKEKISQHRLGYIGLGICLDYFIFKPVRSLKPLVFFCIGFGCGIVYTTGLNNIINYVKGLLA